MADSTLTIKIVSQTGGNPPAKPPAPQAQAPGNAPQTQAPGNAPKERKQVAPLALPTISTTKQPRAERPLEYLTDVIRSLKDAVKTSDYTPPAPQAQAPGNAPKAQAPGNAPKAQAPGNVPQTQAPGNAPKERKQVAPLALPTISTTKQPRAERPLEYLTDVIRSLKDAVKTSDYTPPAPQAQAPGNAPAGSVQVAPRSSSTTSSATKQQAQAERSLATLAIGMFANQGFNTLTDALGTIPGQSRNAKRLSNIGGGAIAGATAGAMLGPAGMAVGAAIGTAAGALKTLADEAKETRDALRSLKDSAKMTGYTTGAKRQDAAFVRSLQWMTREQQDEAITERANQIKRGDGDTSIRSLTNAIEAMAKRGLTDTPEYKEKQNLLAMQKSRLATLGELDDKNYFQNLPTLLKGSEHADALQKIGGQIGATINVKDSDREMINLLREISTSTRILATNAPNSKRALDASSGPGVYLP